MKVEFEPIALKALLKMYPASHAKAIRAAFEIGCNEGERHNQMKVQTALEDLFEASGITTGVQL